MRSKTLLMITALSGLAAAALSMSTAANAHANKRGYVPSQATAVWSYLGQPGAQDPDMNVRLQMRRDTAAGRGAIGP